MKLLRLRNQKDFNAVIAAKRGYRSEHFSLSYSYSCPWTCPYTNEEAGCPGLHLGFKISRKVANSCKRNLLKRRVRHIIFTLAKANVIKYRSIVFLARKGVTNLSFENLQQEIHKALAMKKTVY